jgi:hypothetical protein
MATPRANFGIQYIFSLDILTRYVNVCFLNLGTSEKSVELPSDAI